MFTLFLFCQWSCWILLTQAVGQTSDKLWGGKTETWWHSMEMIFIINTSYLLFLLCFSLLISVFCWAVTTVTRYLVWVLRELWAWSRSTIVLRTWFWTSIQRYKRNTSKLLFSTAFTWKKDQMRPTCLLSFRLTLYHNCGNTKRQGRFSWRHHKPELLSSPGLNQMKKLWSGSSVPPSTLGLFFPQTCFLFSHNAVNLWNKNWYKAHLGSYISGRRGFVIGWRRFATIEKIVEKQGKRRGQREVRGRLEWRTSLKLPERENKWVVVKHANKNDYI